MTPYLTYSFLNLCERLLEVFRRFDTSYSKCQTVHGTIILCFIGTVFESALTSWHDIIMQQCVVVVNAINRPALAGSVLETS